MRLARSIKQYVYEHEGKVYKATVYWYSTGEGCMHWTRLSNGQEVPLLDIDATEVGVFHDTIVADDVDDSDTYRIRD